MEEVFVEAADGIKLHGLWIPAEDPRGTVLFAHGYRSTYMVDFGAAMEFYHQRGMNLLLPCQRGHGKSQGRYITFGVKESRDMECWIAFHNENLSKAPIILDGLSMGASTMLYLADRKLPDNVKGIIADCGFTSPKDIISHVFTRTTHMPAAPSIYVAELFARLFADFSLWECDTRRSLSGSRLPVLMVHGTGDEFVPHEMTKMGYDACTSEKKLLLAEGAGHGVSFIQERERYSQLVDAFLEKLL